jgi:hypothetical protein
MTDQLVKDKDKPEIIWVRLPDALNLLWPQNPKKHDIGALCQALQKYGFQDLPKLDYQLTNRAGEPGAIKSGNGRIEALSWLRRDGKDVPRGIALDADGEWVIPIVVGVDGQNANEAKAYAIDANNLTMMGGDFTAYDFMRMWEQDNYLSISQELAENNALPVSVTGDDLDRLLFVVQADKEQKEYDESVESEVEYIECPKCGHKFPK